MTDRNGRAMDVLDRALAALRDAPVPEGPSPELVASTVEALETMAGPATVRIDKRRQFMFRIVRYGGVAAALGFVAITVGWLFLMDRTAAPAFGDVVQKIKDARSVTFIQEMPTIVRGTTHDEAGKRWIMRSKFYIQGDVCRMELPSVQDGVTAPADAPPNYVVVILDGKEKKALQLNYVDKTAKTTTADEKFWQHVSRSLGDPIKQLRQLKEQDAQRIGEEELDGVKTQVYRLQGKDIFMGITLDKDDSAKLWVDPKTGLPVRLAIGDPEDKDKMFMVFKDFRWNEALDPRLFNLAVPKGFTVKDQ